MDITTFKKCFGGKTGNANACNLTIYFVFLPFPLQLRLREDYLTRQAESCVQSTDTPLHLTSWSSHPLKHDQPSILFLRYSIASASLLDGPSSIIKIRTIHRMISENGESWCFVSESFLGRPSRVIDIRTIHRTDIRTWKEWMLCCRVVP